MTTFRWCTCLVELCRKKLRNLGLATGGGWGVAEGLLIALRAMPVVCVSGLSHTCTLWMVSWGPIWLCGQ